MKRMLKDTAILLIITVIAGLLLGLVYQITKDPIAEQEEKTKEKAWEEVFPDAASFAEIEILAPDPADWEASGFDRETIDAVMEALDNDGALLGYVITVTTKEGYNGDIQFSLGIQNDGTLNGMSIISISETAGLGMRAEEVLKPQFADKNVTSFVYTKTGATQENEIDAISGATITTNAVTTGVNAGLYYFRTFLEGGE